MDLAKLISGLRRELELVDDAIRSLEPLAVTSTRKGRPKKETGISREGIQDIGRQMVTKDPPSCGTT